MNIALVQNSQHDIDRNERRQDQYGLVGERGQERRRSSLKGRLNGRRHVAFVLDFVYGVNRVAQRSLARQVERKGDHRKLTLMIHGEGNIGFLHVGEGRQRHLPAIGERRRRSDLRPPKGVIRGDGGWKGPRTKWNWKGS